MKTQANPAGLSGRYALGVFNLTAKSQALSVWDRCTIDRAVADGGLSPRIIGSPSGAKVFGTTEELELHDF